MGKGRAMCPLSKALFYKSKLIQALKNSISKYLNISRIKSQPLNSNADNFLFIQKTSLRRLSLLLHFAAS